MIGEWVLDGAPLIGMALVKLECWWMDGLLVDVCWDSVCGCVGVLAVDLCMVGWVGGWAGPFGRSHNG